MKIDEDVSLWLSPSSRSPHDVSESGTGAGLYVKRLGAHVLSAFTCRKSHFDLFPMISQCFSYVFYRFFMVFHGFFPWFFHGFLCFSIVFRCFFYGFELRGSPKVGELQAFASRGLASGSGGHPSLPICLAMGARPQFPSLLGPEWVSRGSNRMENG